MSGIDTVKSVVIGAVQGLCLPFRGFSRSGGTISAGLLVGIERRQIEEFSFALAVVLHTDRRGHGATPSRQSSPRNPPTARTGKALGAGIGRHGL